MIVEEARSKLSNNSTTKFDNVALNANFITHAHTVLHSATIVAVAVRHSVTPLSHRQV